MVLLRHPAISQSTEGKWAKAVEYFQSSKFDEAIRRLETAHQLAPTNPDDTPLFAGREFTKRKMIFLRL
jgi:hypothetical protein